MVQTLVELTKDLTSALVQTGNVSAENMQETLEKTYATLASLKAQDESDAPAPEPASKAAACKQRFSWFGRKYIKLLNICGLNVRQYFRTFKLGFQQSHKTQIFWGNPDF